MRLLLNIEYSMFFLQPGLAQWSAQVAHWLVVTTSHSGSLTVIVSTNLDQNCFFLLTALEPLSKYILVSTAFAATLITPYLRKG